MDEDGNEYVSPRGTFPLSPQCRSLSALGHDVIAAIGAELPSQRWRSEHETFVRPIRWICALLGSEVVPVTYADVTSGNTTRGHRVLAPGEHAVAEPAAYEQVLKDSYVLGAEAREAAIREGIAAIEAERPGSHVDTPARIFDEVVNLCSGRPCLSAPSTRSSSACRRRLSASPCSPTSAISRFSTPRASLPVSS